MSLEKAVRDAAANLHKAISEATAAGYRIYWPGSADGLPGIAISETAKVKLAAPVVAPKVDPTPEAKPAPAPSRFARAAAAKGGS